MADELEMPRGSSMGVSGGLLAAAVELEASFALAASLDAAPGACAGMV